ncbi:MAG TPA: hypothetical protein ENH07_10440, partial [Nitrospirae bacterium]|nr:hypothetical protein [Nitrospirota bacterium]
MTKVMEASKWTKGKRPILTKYLSAHSNIERQVAAHGFLYLPTFLGAAITEIEALTKFELSELNYQIVAEAIERELAQTGYNYDIQVKEAQIAWELEKTALLTALQQEFADNKRVRDLDNQTLDRLEITTNLRKLVIIALKTAIDINMEELRQEMTHVDQSTFPAEDALLAARLLTAQKKLEVIPYIKTVLEKQQLVIDAEEDNADRKTALITEKEALNDKRVELITAREAIAGAIVNLITAKQDLVTKREDLIGAKGLIATQETTNISYLDQYISALGGLSDVQQNLVEAREDLIPYINDKSTALLAYVTELDAWVAVKQTIARIKEDIADYMEDRVDKKGDIIDSRKVLNTLELGLEEARISLTMAQLTGRSNLLSAEVMNAATMLTEREASFASKIIREGALIGGQIDLDLYTEWVALETMSEVNDI